MNEAPLYLVQLLHRVAEDHPKLTGWTVEDSTAGSRVWRSVKKITVLAKGGRRERQRELLHEIAHVLAQEPAPGHGPAWWLEYARLLCVYHDYMPPSRSDLIALAANMGWPQPQETG